MSRGGMKAYCVSAIMFLFSLMAGCGGGGGGGGSLGGSSVPGTPDIEVLPAGYGFGTVTIGNSPAPLEVEINNNGSVALSVSDITLMDKVNFSLKLSGGSNPCYTTSPTIAAGSNCTFEVTFRPTSDRSFNSGVAINSNDSGTPRSFVALSGISSELSSLEASISQINKADCPDLITAYVSVLDQEGYPLTGLQDDPNFNVNEFGIDIGPFDYIVYTGAAHLPGIAITAVMDLSSSLTDKPGAVSNMEAGLVSFLRNLRDEDDAEIIKFNAEFEVVQGFTADQDLLVSAITAAFDREEATLLYDSIYKALEDTSQRVNRRKAVIVITDGVDDDGSGNQLSTNSFNDVVSFARDNDIPIFTIGIGSSVIQVDLLRQMAEDTHGSFFEAQNSDHLRTIFQQLSSLLFANQYIVRYWTNQGGGSEGLLTIDVTDPATLLTGSDTRSFTACP